MRPAASFTGGFRFEKGNMARAMFYDPGLTSSAKWNDANFSTLVGGIGLMNQTATLALTLAAIILL